MNLYRDITVLTREEGLSVSYLETIPFHQFRFFLDVHYERLKKIQEAIEDAKREAESKK